MTPATACATDRFPEFQLKSIPATRCAVEKQPPPGANFIGEARQTCQY
jgi:hypothetical protein